MNRALFAHTWRSNRFRLAIVAVALLLWGAVLPIIYDAFGEQFRELMESGIFPEQMTQFGGGDIFSLTGSVALGFIHPLAVGLNLVFAVGFAGAAVAGEAQRGTLEVLLARPISRRTVYGTFAAAAALFLAVTVAALTLGALLGAAVTGPRRRARGRQPADRLAQRVPAVRRLRVDRARGVRLVRSPRRRPSASRSRSSSSRTSSTRSATCGRTPRDSSRSRCSTISMPRPTWRDSRAGATSGSSAP